MHDRSDSKYDDSNYTDSMWDIWTSFIANGLIGWLLGNKNMLQFYD